MYREEENKKTIQMSLFTKEQVLKNDTNVV